ncbi:MAG: hypothetical protein SFZ24_08290 [Planctomycetota bacterium]|nr:hypothetical protein [Planctomycetota bacterium]
MPQLFSTRSWWILAGALVAVGGVSIGTLARTSAREPWRERLDAVVPMRDAAIEPPGLKGEAFATCVRITNEILRRPAWRAEDVRELLDIMAPGYPRPLGDRAATPADRARYYVFSEASLALSFRLESGAPVDAAARDLIVDHWLNELHEAFPERRIDAALELVFHGCIEDRGVRALVETVLDDPEPDNRETLARQLARYDDVKLRTARYEAKTGRPMVDERGGRSN